MREISIKAPTHKQLLELLVSTAISNKAVVGISFCSFFPLMLLPFNIYSLLLFSFFGIFEHGFAYMVRAPFIFQVTQ